MHHPSPSLDDAPADQQQPAGVVMGKAEKEAFGSAVRAARKQKGWTQAELARRVGTARTYLSQVEKGRVGTNHDTMVKIAKALGRPLRDLITH